MGIHFFDTEIAEKYDIECAIMLQNIAYWVELNTIHEKHFYKGKYWTYNSAREFNLLFPYMNEKKIQRTLIVLEEEGLIESDYLSKNPMNHTKWYTLTEKGFETAKTSKRQNDLSITPNCLINTDNKHTNNNINNNNINNNTSKDVSATSVSENVSEGEGERLTQKTLNQIVANWNTLSVYGVPKLQKLVSSSMRYKNLKARINEYSVEDVLKAIEIVKHSDFLQGKCHSVGRNDFKLTFNWFVLPNNFVKVLEGNYLNSGYTVDDIVINYADTETNEKDIAEQKLIEEGWQ